MKNMKNNMKDTSKLQVTQDTLEKAEIVKRFIEKKYQKNFDEEKRKKEYYDRLIIRMQNMNLTEHDQLIIKNELITNELRYLREKRKKESILDYELRTIIGRGAFGEVRLCRNLHTNTYVAVKKMNKSEMNKKNQLNHIRAERDVLANANSDWVVDLKSSFKDFKNLYLVMEFLPGGDLMNLLIEKDVFTEEEAVFYMAESILAVETVHKLNYIHRDLKPDNILIGKDGHIKLTDFGLCKLYNDQPSNAFFDEYVSKAEKINTENVVDGEFKKRDRQKVYSMVGTVDYIAPEVFSKDGYTEVVDWWSLGTILFEMLMGYPPFYGKDPTTTCKKVMNYKRYFEIPPESKISPEAKDLLKKLITDPEKRLGRNGVQEIKNHPFFASIDWDNIRKMKAPYIPKLKSNIDTSNFEKFEETVNWHDEYIKYNKSGYKNKKGMHKDFFWIGYTFKQPRNYEDSKPLEEIFEKLKLKKQNEGKRLFSEEKINNLDDSGYKNLKIINYDQSSSNLNFSSNKRGFNFMKKNKNPKVFNLSKKNKKIKFDSSNKNIFQSLTEAEQNHNHFTKQYELNKKKTKMDKRRKLNSL